MKNKIYQKWLAESCRFLGLDPTLLPESYGATGLHLTGNNMLYQLQYPNEFDTLLWQRTLTPDPDSAERAFESLRITTEDNQADENPSGFESELVDHFVEQVIGQNKIGGKARAMVVTGSVQRAIQYFFAFRDYLTEIKSPHQAIVAFSGEPEYNGEKVSEAKLNGFSTKTRYAPNRTIRRCSVVS